MGGGHLAASAGCLGGWAQQPLAGPAHLGRPWLWLSALISAPADRGHLPKLAKRTSQVVSADASQGTGLCRGVAPTRPPGPPGRAPRRPRTHGCEWALGGQRGPEAQGPLPFTSRISGLEPRMAGRWTRTAPQGWCETATPTRAAPAASQNPPAQPSPQRGAPEASPRGRTLTATSFLTAKHLSGY